VLPCSARDASRFLQLEIPQERLTTTGNIKLDVPIPVLDEAERTRLRRELGISEGLLLAGASTWPGEEEALIRALVGARSAGLRCALLLVPRHAERRFAVEEVLRSSGLRYQFRSRGAAPGPVDVAVGDTTGELRRLVQLADLVFVGKSLPPHTEGQTPVEAALLGKPVLFGPGMGNFADIAEDLLASGAALRVAGSEELATAVRELFADPDRRSRLAAAAAAWRRENGGAMARTLAIIGEELARLPPP
jgi:3-deoxy-D-manno-octulosonic-acid transferase